MTGIEKRLRAAKANSHRAMARAELARKKLDLDCRAYREGRMGAVDAAHKAARTAIAAVTALELEQAGIVPGATIVRYQGALWTVRIKVSGYAELDPMTKDGKPHMGRYAIPTPYRLSMLQVTDMTAKA